MDFSNVEGVLPKPVAGPQSNSHLSALTRKWSILPGDAQPNSPDNHTSKYVDEGDPLHNDRVLLQGRRIADPGDNGPNAIRKVPSDQMLPMFRWGTKHRITGRSKSGLQILVPGREVPATVVTGGPLSGKSIIYTYASSSESSGKTTNSIGAIGDHLSAAKTNFLSSTKLLAVPEDPSIEQDRAPANAVRRPSSPLAAIGPEADGHNASLTDLVADSTPDVGPYKLYIRGETGPCAGSISTMPRVVSLADFPMLPSRRRSLSDLVEDTKALDSPTSVDVPASVISQISTASETVSSDRSNSSWQGVPIDTTGPAKTPEPLTAPVWERAGPPFSLIHGTRLNVPAQGTHLPDEFDPPSFCFPFGSKVFIMKTPDFHSLRASVVTGVWSSSIGANKVLQNAWDSKAKDEKIVFLFSISHSHLYSGKYCGMAEMSGPYDPDVDPQFWIAGLAGSEGIIPIRWIVTKDVDYSAFVDLKYKGKFVTQLRHANTVPGEAGRCLIQAYFETKHPSTSILHPQGGFVGVLPAAPFGILSQGSKWRTPRTITPSRRILFRAESNTAMTSGHRSQPTHGVTERDQYPLRFNAELPPPPFSLPTSISRRSGPGAAIMPDESYHQAGPGQSMTLNHWPLGIHGRAGRGVCFQTSNPGYSAAVYASPAPFFSQAPINGTPRPYTAPHVTYTSNTRAADLHAMPDHAASPSLC